MTKQREGGLTHIGDLLSSLNLPVLSEAIPKKRTKPKKIGPSVAEKQLLDTAVSIHAEPDAAERAYIARQLILCTLPHSDPGSEQPRWQRRTGNLALVLQPGWDAEKDQSIGFPFGSLPRLLLFWVISEAVVKKSRRLLLGRSLNEFIRAVGLNPDTGGGKRSDNKRLKEQMRRLFRCHISFQAVGKDPSGAKGERWQDMPVAPKGEFWWHPHPDQAALWESWIELGEEFYNAVVASPVPLDMRVLRALKRSPLALDLYAMLSYRAYVIVTKGLPPQLLNWEQLRRQFGTDHKNVKDFKKKANGALRKIKTLYPGLTISPAKGGFTINATRLAVPPKIA